MVSANVLSPYARSVMRSLLGYARSALRLLRALRCSPSRRLPREEPLSGLAAQFPAGHLVAQQPGRLETLAEFPPQMLGGSQAHVEPDQICGAQRSHRMAVRELHSPVDRRRVGDTVLEHPDRLEAEEDTEAAGREAGRVADHDLGLGQPAHP